MTKITEQKKNAKGVSLVPFRALVALITTTFLMAVGLMAEHAYAADIYGYGVESCGAWTAQRRDPRRAHEREQAQQWVLGYVGGAVEWHAASMNPMWNTDAEGMWAWLDQFCAENPVKSLMFGTFRFVLVQDVDRKMHEKKTTSPQPGVEKP